MRSLKSKTGIDFWGSSLKYCLKWPHPVSECQVQVPVPAHTHPDRQQYLDPFYPEDTQIKLRIPVFHTVQPQLWCASVERVRGWKIYV